MQRLFTFITILLTGFTLTASEKAAVKQTIIACYQSQIDLDGSRAISFYHKKYESINARGESGNYRQELELNLLLNVFKRLHSPDWTVLDLAEITAFCKGESLTEDDRALGKLLADDPELKKHLAPLRAEVLLWVKQLQDFFRASTQTLNFISIRTNRNRAVVVYTIKSIDSDDLEQITCELVKENGKWLIIKEVSK